METWGRFSCHMSISNKPGGDKHVETWGRFSCHTPVTRPFLISPVKICTIMYEMLQPENRHGR